MRRIGLLLLLPMVLAAQSLEISSSALSEGAEQVVGKRAHMTGEIRLLAGGRLAGPAATIRLVRDPSGPRSNPLPGIRGGRFSNCRSARS
jgi:hypothetical protein